MVTRSTISAAIATTGLLDHRKPPPIIHDTSFSDNSETAETPVNHPATLALLIGGLPTTFPVCPFMAKVYCLWL